MAGKLVGWLLPGCGVREHLAVLHVLNALYHGNVRAGACDPAGRTPLYATGVPDRSVLDSWAIS